MIEIRHPEHQETAWNKYQKAFDAGHDFVDEYVRQFSTREDPTDFTNRKEYSYCAAFAKGAINEVRNSIFQRINDITREGGSDKYKEAFLGKNGGVDLQGSSMNAFIGREVLPQLLVKGKIGVFVDMPNIEHPSLASQKDKRPYLYIYRAEDILSWVMDYNDKGYFFTKLLLRDTIDELKDGLPTGTITRYRHLEVVGNEVHVTFYNDEDEQVDSKNQPSNAIVILEIPVIPFCIAELTDSLMKDIADYQIAHTNLASSDLSYALRSNFPFYVEQIDPRAASSYLRQNSDSYSDATPGTNTDANTSNNTEANSKISSDLRRSVGSGDGRQYTVGTNEPAFIHPSPEPLMASMAKQDKLKLEVRELVHLALTNVEPKMASAESKELDQGGLEAGLSYIGLELETLERCVARIWVMYEGSKSEITVVYPKRYSLKSDTEKRTETKELKEQLHSTPSKTYKTEISKTIATVLLGDRVTTTKLKKIHKEITDANIIDTDPEIINKDVETGLVSVKDASESRGYPAGSAETAQIEHAARLARIKEAQSDGVADDKDSPNQDGRNEKEASRNTDEDPTPKDKQRGNAK